MLRTAEHPSTNAPMVIDSMTYHYAANTNRLTSLSDGATPVSGYEHAVSSSYTYNYQKALDRFNDISEEYRATDNAINAFSLSDPNVFNEVDKLTYYDGGPAVDVYYRLIPNLMSNYDDHSLKALIEKIPVDGATKHSYDMTINNEVYGKPGLKYYTVTSEFGKNSISVIISKSLLSYRKTFKHESGHAIFETQTQKTTIDWQRSHPDQNPHQDSNPSEQKAREYENK